MFGPAPQLQFFDVTDVDRRGAPPPDMYAFGLEHHRAMAPPSAQSAAPFQMQVPRLQPMQSPQLQVQPLPPPVAPPASAPPPARHNGTLGNTASAFAYWPEPQVTRNGCNSPGDSTSSSPAAAMEPVKTTWIGQHAVEIERKIDLRVEEAFGRLRETVHDLVTKQVSETLTATKELDAKCKRLQDQLNVQQDLQHRNHHELSVKFVRLEAAYAKLTDLLHDYQKAEKESIDARSMMDYTKTTLAKLGKESDARCAQSGGLHERVASLEKTVAGAAKWQATHATFDEIRKDISARSAQHASLQDWLSYLEQKLIESDEKCMNLEAAQRQFYKLVKEHEDRDQQCAAISKEQASIASSFASLLERLESAEKVIGNAAVLQSRRGALVANAVDGQPNRKASSSKLVGLAERMAYVEEVIADTWEGSRSDVTDLRSQLAKMQEEHIARGSQNAALQARVESLETAVGDSCAKHSMWEAGRALQQNELDAHAKHRLSLEKRMEGVEQFVSDSREDRGKLEVVSGKVAKLQKEFEARCALHGRLQQRIDDAESQLAEHADKHARVDAAHVKLSRIQKEHEAQSVRHASLQERVEAVEEQQLQVQQEGDRCNELKSEFAIVMSTVRDADTRTTQVVALQERMGHVERLLFGDKPTEWPEAGRCSGSGRRGHSPA